MTSGYLLLTCPIANHHPGLCSCLTRKDSSLRAAWFQIPLSEILITGNPFYCRFSADRIAGYLDTGLPDNAWLLMHQHHSLVPSIAAHLAASADNRKLGLWEPPEVPRAAKGEEVLLAESGGEAAGGGGEGKGVAEKVRRRKNKVTVPEEELSAEKRQCRRCLKFKVQAEMDPYTRACKRCKAYSDARTRGLREMRLQEGAGRRVRMRRERG